MREEFWLNHKNENIAIDWIWIIRTKVVCDSSRAR